MIEPERSENVVQIQDRVIAMMFTTKKIRRPANPRKCSSKGYYHVWRWRGGPRVPIDHSCACGLLQGDPRGQS